MIDVPFSAGWWMQVSSLVALVLLIANVIRGMKKSAKQEIQYTRDTCDAERGEMRDEIRLLTCEIERLRVALVLSEIERNKLAEELARWEATVQGPYR
jgi:hypothetical protein